MERVGSRGQLGSIISEARGLRSDARHLVSALRPRLEEMLHDPELQDSLGSYPEYSALWYAVFELQTRVLHLNERLDKRVLPFLPEGNPEALSMDMRSTMLFAMLEEYFGWQEVMAREADDLDYLRQVQLCLELGDYVRADELLSAVRALLGELDACVDQVQQLQVRRRRLLRDDFHPAATDR